MVVTSSFMSSQNQFEQSNLEKEKEKKLLNSDPKIISYITKLGESYKPGSSRSASPSPSRLHKNDNLKDNNEEIELKFNFSQNPKSLENSSFVYRSPRDSLKGKERDTKQSKSPYRVIKANENIQTYKTQFRDDSNKFLRANSSTKKAYKTKRENNNKPQNQIQIFESNPVYVLDRTVGNMNIKRMPSTEANTIGTSGSCSRDQFNRGRSLESSKNYNYDDKSSKPKGDKYGSIVFLNN